MGRSTCTTAFIETIQYFAYTMKTHRTYICIDKMTAMRTFFPACIYIYVGNACAMIVHTLADQLLPQFLTEQFDTLPHYMHIGHLHEGV